MNEVLNAVKVLVADDGRDNREFIVDYILRPNGFTPLLARDGVEAMEMVRAHEPDIILLDLQMPRMDGMQVLDALQEGKFDIPVILMTFHGSEDVAIEVYRKGVRDYVRKPYTVDEMMEAIERALGEVRLRRDKEALTARLLRANSSLTRRVKELNTLYQIGKSVTGLVSLDQLLPRVVDAAIQVVEAEQGKLLLLEGDQLVCRAQRLHIEPRARPINEAYADRIAMRAAQTGKPVVLSPEELVEHRATDPTLPAAVACIPLHVGERVVGVLSVENVSIDARPFTQENGALLEMLGDYAAIAIENARNYSALEVATLSVPNCCAVRLHAMSRRQWWSVCCKTRMRCSWAAYGVRLRSCLRMCAAIPRSLNRPSRKRLCNCSTNISPSRRMSFSRAKGRSTNSWATR
ncbi:MAG: response regulator [Anaerolineae bacterium]|nr:response regulator [Anaerolineae bacterium]